nr:PREDICTED: uncharacterized protein LOC104141109 [Struthio camelus australis]
MSAQGIRREPGQAAADTARHASADRLGTVGPENTRQDGCTHVTGPSRMFGSRSWDQSRSLSSGWVRAGTRVEATGQETVRTTEQSGRLRYYEYQRNEMGASESEWDLCASPQGVLATPPLQPYRRAPSAQAKFSRLLVDIAAFPWPLSSGSRSPGFRVLREQSGGDGKDDKKQKKSVCFGKTGLRWRCWSKPQSTRQKVVSKKRADAYDIRCFRCGRFPCDLCGYGPPKQEVVLRPELNSTEKTTSSLP